MKLRASILKSIRSGRKSAIGECETPSRTQAIDFSLVSTLLALIITVVSVVDRLTPAFTGLFSYRGRIVGGIGVAACALGLSIKIITTTHTCTGRIEATVVRHFSYHRRYRLQAKIALIPICLALLLSLESLKFFNGNDGPVEARIVGVHGRPVSGVVVDAINLDESSTTQHSTISASRGDFVLDIVPHNGRSAYLVLTWNTCTSKQVFPDELLHQLEVKESSDVFNQSQPTTVIRLDCAGG